jgi:hypothetical protein
MDELAALRAAVEGQDDLFAALSERVAALSERAATVEGQVEALREREDPLAAANARFDQVRAHVDGLIARYRTALVADLPEPARPLVTGETPEDLERAAEAVRATVRAVAEGVREDAAARVPLGAAPRQGPDTGALSAREKIALGLSAEGR